MEDKKEKSNKKKIILIICSLFLIIAIGIVTAIVILAKDKNRPSVKEEKIEAREQSIVIGKELPSLKDYIQRDIEGRITYTLDQKEVDNPKEIGTYKVTIKIGDKEYTTKLSILPKEIDLVLKEVTINEGEQYKIEDFITSCSGNTECTYSFADEKQKSIKEVGKHDIKIIAKDDYKEIEASTKLTINKKEDKSKTNNKTTNNSSSKNPSSTKTNISTNKNTQGNKTNTSPENNTGSTKPQAPTKTVVNTKNITETTTEDYKYGVKINYNTTYEITTYSDGTQDKKEIGKSKKYDFSGYSATANDLRAEASTLVSQNAGIYQEVTSLTNNLRTESDPNKSQLVLDPNLTLAATIRALEMAYASKFSHTRPNGNSCFSTLGELGISYGGAGENIATGYGSAASVVNGWKNSSGHYANMVNAGFNKIGVGYVSFNGQKYWVQMFTS